jgi:hypothetical protein
MGETMILAPLPDSFDQKARKNLSKTIKRINAVKNQENTLTLSFHEFLRKCQVSYKEYILAIRSSLRSHRVFLKRLPRQMLINAYNPDILKRMRSNMDIQFILDPYGVACYVVDYINKTDRGMSDTMSRAWKEIRSGNYSLKEGFRKIVNTYYNNSEMSVQEACYNILQLHLSECSEECVYIPTTLPAERVRMVKSDEELSCLDPKSTNIFVDNIISHYTNRPLSLSNISLADFAAFYKFTYKQSASTLSLLNKKGFLHKRSRPRIIRFRNYTYETEPDNYFREHIMLYLPWRHEKKDILNKDWQKVFHENIHQIKSEKKKFHMLKDDKLKTAYSEAYNDTEYREGQVETDKEFLKFDFDDYRLDPQHYTDVEEEYSGNNSFYEMFKLPTRVSEEEYLHMLQKLNADQRDYVYNIAHHFKHSEEPIYHLLTGGAGVGKSLVIKVIYQTLIRIFNSNIDDDPDQPTVLLAAPTGKAAFNIKGQTIHSALKLPINQSTLSELSADISNTLATRYARLRVVILDEISMVGQTTFNMVDQRLRHWFNPEKPFGGLSVIAVGDFFQLRPVYQRSLYSPVSSNPYRDLFEENIWHKFAVFKLSKIMRQDEPQFQIALNNLAKGNLTQDDLNLFRTRSFHTVPDIPNAQNAVHLFPTNAQVDHFNNIAVSSLPGKSHTCTASDIISGEGSAAAKRQMLYTLERSKTSECMGIPKDVILKEGARYMLTYNVSTINGLVNGATGTLKKIDFGKNTTGAKKPLRLWIHFDDASVGEVVRAKNSNLASRLHYPHSWTPLEPIVVKIRTRKNSSLHINRKQFPLTLAHALTIHKSQGQTLETVVVHLQNNIRRDLLYVACSRATTLNGLYLIGTFHPPTPLNENDHLAQEIKRWESTMLLPKFRFLREQHDGLQVMYHNIQSLQKNWDLIQADKIYQKTDILMFAETRSSLNDQLYMKKHTCIQRINTDHHSKPRGLALFIANKIQHLVNNSGHRIVQNSNKRIEVCWIVIHDTLFAAIYANPKSSTKEFMELFKYLHHIPKKHTVVIGDFNRNNLHPEQIHRIQKCTVTHLKLRNKSHITTVNGTSIDWILSDIKLSCGVYTSMLSYHEPIWARIAFSKFNKKNQNLPK